MIKTKAILIQFILLFSMNLCLICLSVPAIAGTNYFQVIDNGKIKIVLNCNNKASVVAMYVNGRKVIDAPDGMYTAISHEGKKFTSLHLLQKPSCNQTKNNIVIKNIIYGDKELTVSETWTFQKKGNSLEWKIARKFSDQASIDISAAPVINFTSIKTWDGAFQGYGGLAWFYLFNEKPSSYGVHSKSSSFWRNGDPNGLNISVSSPGNEVAMTYKRTKEDRLAYSIAVSRQQIVPLMDKGTQRRLFVRGEAPVWAPVVATGATNLTITFAYVNTAQRDDRGKLAGVNGAQVGAVLNTIARIGVIDSLHYGGNSWATPYGPICLHEQYIAQLGLGINDPRYLNGYKACLDFYRDHAIKQDGRVYSRWAYTNEDAAPGQYNEYGFYEAQWGTLMDSNPDYVSNVADLFDLTGDRRWVRGQQQACEKVLDWILRRDENHNGLVEMMNGNQDERKSSDWIDIVWASYENAFVNAKLYYALKKWAAVESILGDQVKAKTYAGLAIRLKSSFNKPTDQGGFWDEQNKCYVHWRDNKGAIHGRNMVTPVNFMAIAYGICDQQDRKGQILDAIERQMQQENLFFWPLTMTSYEPGELRKDQLPFPNYENGDLFLSWGSIGVAAYAKYRPEIALKYVRNVLNQYGKDGLAFQRYSRKDQSGKGDDILSGNSLAIVGLYQSLYGVNPLYNRLLIDPHLTSELTGSRLKYRYHEQLLEISLDKEEYAVSNGRVELRSKTRFGFAVNGNVLSYFNDNHEQPDMQISGAGKLQATVDTWTDQTKTFNIIYQNGYKRPVTCHIMQLRPHTTYKVSINHKQISTIESDEKGHITLIRKPSATKDRVSITFP
ncbi:hypothetical protein ACFQZX_05755 [Mucilaginibacter litoreus]|uniref:Alpha-L-rhamnosidase six-hairpin glycosidase domain-containing protein n=1 Tax=Mucilaginibacter litoreus TaxID=1048221 RepID=A0ABW3APZ2_9SPHI